MYNRSPHQLFNESTGLERRTNVYDTVLPHPATSYTVEIEGDSMIPEMRGGDLAIVEYQQPPRSGEIIAAALDGETLIKRLIIDDGHVHLHSENPKYPDVDVTEFQSFEVLGVVRNVVRRMK